MPDKIRNIQIQQQIRDLKNQLEDAAARQDGKVALRLEQQIEFLKSTLEAVMPKGKVQKRMDRGSYAQRAPVTGKLSRTSLLESRALRATEQLGVNVELGDYCDFGPYGKHYVVGEHGGFYLIQDEVPTKNDFADPNLTGAIHQSDFVRVIKSYEDTLNEESEDEDFEESVREQDEPSADTDHRWDELELSPVKPVARLFLLQSSPSDTKLKLRIQTREGKVLYESILNAETDNLSTAIDNAHQFASKVGVELDEDPSMVTQWSAATKRARQQLGLQSDVELGAVKQGEARKREQAEQSYSWGRIKAALVRATVVPSMIVRVRSALGSRSRFTWEEINAALMRLQWQPANIAHFLTILKQGNLGESRRREALLWEHTKPFIGSGGEQDIEVATIGDLEFRIENLGNSCRLTVDQGGQKVYRSGTFTTLEEAKARAESLSYSLSRQGESRRRHRREATYDYNAIKFVAQDMSDKGSTWQQIMSELQRRFNLQQTEVDELRTRLKKDLIHSREGVTWPLTIPAGWQNVSGLLPTIQKIISANGARRYVKIIFDTKSGVLRVQGTPKPTNMTYAPTENGLYKARVDAEAALATQESRRREATIHARLLIDPFKAEKLTLDQLNDATVVDSFLNRVVPRIKLVGTNQVEGPVPPFQQIGEFVPVSQQVGAQGHSREIMVMAEVKVKFLRSPQWEGDRLTGSPLSAYGVPGVRLIDYYATKESCNPKVVRNATSRGARL